MQGSLRKRGNSWELRAYAGTDPETGKRNWVSATVKGSRRAAQHELVELVSRVDYPRRMTSKATVAKLLTDWFDAEYATLDRHLAASTGGLLSALILLAGIPGSLLGGYLAGDVVGD